MLQQTPHTSDIGNSECSHLVPEPRARPQTRARWPLPLTWLTATVLLVVTARPLTAHVTVCVLLTADQSIHSPWHRNVALASTTSCRGAALPRTWMESDYGRVSKIQARRGIVVPAVTTATTSLSAPTSAEQVREREAVPAETRRCRKPKPVTLQ